MEFVFHELQVQHMAEKGIEALRLARRMLDGFTRALLIDSGLGDRSALVHQAERIAAEFNWRLEKTKGSLESLRRTIGLAIDSQRKKR